MPVNFPSAPSLNQTYTYNNVVWTWTGNRWEVQHNYDMQGVYFTYSNAAPASPRLGDRWLYSESLVELVYVYDGTSYQWVEVSSQAGAGAVRDLSNLITTSINASLVPASNVAYDLGSSSLRWRDLYLSGNTIDLGGTAIKSSANGVSFTSVTNAAAAVPLTVSSLQIASATGNVVTLQASATGLQTVGTTGNVVATTPGGSSGQLQYNLAGAFAGAANVVYASTGQLLRGASSARTNWLGGGGAIGFQNEGLDAVSGSMGTIRGGVNGFPAYLIIGKTRSATVGGSDAVINNDLIGTLDFQAADGTNMIRTASIGAAVDGTVSTGVVPGRLAMFTANAGGVLTERVRLDSSGNLGIGTGSPSARLHINGTSDATQRIIVNGTGNFSSYKLNYNGSEVAFIQSYQNTELNFGTTVNAPILFYVNGAEQMRLTTTGLGIGTNNPTGVLDAGGNTLSTQVFFRNNGAYGSGQGGQTVLNVVFGGMNIAKIANTGTGQRDGTFQLLDENTIKVSISANASRGGDSYINNGGNFGIGTTNPGARVEIYVNRTSSTNAAALILNDNVTGIQTDGVYKAIRSLSNGGSSVSEIRFIETDGTNNNTGIGFATAQTAGGLTERARFNNRGPLVFAGGNLQANGIGITFPATQSASTDANTLDDYEEGSWTPAFGSDGGTTGTQTNTNNWGRYIKIGRQVTVWFKWSGTLSGYTGTLYVGGIPFSVGTAGDSYQYGGNFACTASTATSSNGSNFLFFAYSGALYPWYTTGQAGGYLFTGSSSINGLTEMNGSHTYYALA